MKDTTQLLSQITAASAFIRRHIALIFIVFFAAVCAYIMMLTASLMQAEPEEAAVTEQATAISRPKVNEETVQTIESLEDQNVQVQAIFDEARDNPFNE